MTLQFWIYYFDKRLTSATCRTGSLPVARSLRRTLNGTRHANGLVFATGESRDGGHFRLLPLPLRHKSDAPEAFRIFKAAAENE